MAAAITVLFVPRLRRPAWRPVRGVLFSFMASSAFYPIIYACFIHGYRQMDIEAGATRYLLTIGVYLTAVTTYAVRRPQLLVSSLEGIYSRLFRHAYQKSGGPGSLTSGVIRINYFMYSWPLASQYISPPLPKRSIIRKR